MDDTIISLQAVSFSTENTKVVYDIDLTVFRQQIITLIGPNGSGKSTLAKLLVGIYAPTTGKIIRDERLRVGYVPQHFMIERVLPIRVIEFLHLFAKTSATVFNKIIAWTKTEHLLDAQLAQLSGGQLRRVILARSLLKKPDLLVLDEPLQGVDFHGELELYELINQIHDHLSCGVVLISHDLHVVMSSTSQVVCLNRHICCQGSPQLVSTDAQYKKLFGNQPLAVYTHHHDHQHPQ